jgi:hypothetical protein
MLTIDSISDVFGGWNSGFAVDVSFHYDNKGHRDGFETKRVSLDRDRLVKDDGSYDMEYVAKEVQAKVTPC